jgi:hypothetical protein
VRWQIGAGATIDNEFELASDINNDPNVSATAAWKSTGKPPAIYMHADVFANLIYEDLCGQKGDISRQCNMSGVVISAGDHEAGEAAGGPVDNTAERERNDMLMSPSIQLVGPYTPVNNIGLLAPGTGQGDAEPTEDYYLWYDIYTAVMDPFTLGNLWRFTAQSYPAAAKTTHGSYSAWGQMRFPPFIIFNPDKQCLIDFEPLISLGLVRTSATNPFGIPDSLRVGIGKTQQCFRFGVSSTCSPTDGCYFDNVSMSIIDGVPAQLTVQIWDWYNDSFPANGYTGGVLDGVAVSSANFDTTAAIIKTGLNTAPSPNNNTRYVIGGDSVTVTSSGNTARVDMVFRILPGPGNYRNPTTGALGRPDQAGTRLKKRPDQIALFAQNDGSFWGEFVQTPGDFASTGATVKHNAAPGGWDANVWNSARCDTAELNLFARQAPGSANVLGGPADPAAWMSTYHENDPHYAELGIVKNRCFVTGPADPVSSQLCNGVVPTYISSRPEHGPCPGPNCVQATTQEFTKIIGDGLLTAGSHVEHFFRDQKDSDVPNPVADGFVPDTNLVFQGNEGSTDGHRWQQFGVLPNNYKKNIYRHPVTNDFGAGPACLLVVDGNDRRGNERVWVSVADTIGATPIRYWGAHNGWHAVGDVGSAALDDPAFNRRGKDNGIGYVVEHLGQPGSGGSWDMYQVKASESLTTGAGSLGSRIGNTTPRPVINDNPITGPTKVNRSGPTPGMLNQFYTMMLYLSGDLNSGVLGPYNNRSQNDAGIIISWLTSSASTSDLDQDRGFWAIGDGFVESSWFGSLGSKGYEFALLQDHMGVGLTTDNYIRGFGNTDDLAGYRLFPAWQNKHATQISNFGYRNLCLWTTDVLEAFGVGITLGISTVTSEYDRHPGRPGGPAAATAGIFKDWHAQSKYKTLADGWDIEHLTGPYDTRTRDRNGYFYKIFANVWAKLCEVNGSPLVTLDTPDNSEPELVNFVNLRNNPLARGQATIDFGLSKADRVEVKIFDVTGRLVRSLADRQFTAGPQKLFWDGTDNAGRQVARGVYFTQVKYQNAKFAASRKLTVLK